jgi:SAM-dependent methyltransferase
MDKLVTTDAERFWNPEAFARDEWVRKRAASLPAGSWVLDVGAGASKYRPFFQHCRYETQDFCKYEGPLVQYAEKITYVSDVTAIPLADGVLDAILCTEVFEHLTDPPAALKEFARILKPGGCLWLTAPLLSHLHMEPYHYFGGFTSYWYKHWLPRTGFEIGEIVPCGGPGRTAAYYGIAFVGSWREAEEKWSSPAKALSKLARAATKPLFHWVFPRILPKLDRHLDRERICSGFFVAASRVSP